MITPHQVLMLRNAAGPLLELLEDPTVSEFRCNSDGRVFVLRFRQPKQELLPLPPGVLDRFLDVVADMAGTEWRDSSPRLHAAFPTLGLRLQAGRPPIAEAAFLVVRKHPKQVFPLHDFEAKGVLTAVQRQALEAALLARQTVCLSGPMFTGKTSLLNACIQFLSDTEERMVLLEDDPELVCHAADTQLIHASELAGVTLYDLCLDSMRLSPGWLIVGEVRGKACLHMLKVFQLGHPGLCTVHAGSAPETLPRLEYLVQEESVDPQRPLIGEAIDVIVHLEPYGALSRCTAVLGVDGYDAQTGYRTWRIA